MNKMNKDSVHSVSFFMRHKLNLKTKRFLVLLFCYFSACALSAIPLTLKEVKTYVSGQEQSFSRPLAQVAIATVYGLKKTGFRIDRIEYFDQKCLIYADWQDASVKLVLETVTPKMTEISSKICSGRGSREYSCEGALFDEVREILQQEQHPSWKELTADMVYVHALPDENSPVIAYLRSGAKAEFVESQGDWGKIALMDRAAGYIALKYLLPVSEQKAR